MQILGQRRKEGAEIEQLMLHPAKDMSQLAEPPGVCGFLDASYTSKPDESIQLVHRAVGFNAHRILRNSLPAGQRRFAFIAALGIDPVKRDPRVIESFLRHAFMLTPGYVR